MTISKELVWLAVPLNALLWQIGGTWIKQFRRLGFPVLMVACGLLFSGWSWQIFVAALASFGATCLPFTLWGKHLYDHPVINWLWIWIAGFLIGAYVVILAPGLWYLAMIPCMTQGIAGTLSNIPATEKYFPWKFCEFLIGASAILPLCYFLSR